MEKKNYLFAGRAIMELAKTCTYEKKSKKEWETINLFYWLIRKMQYAIINENICGCITDNTNQRYVFRVFDRSEEGCNGIKFLGEDYYSHFIKGKKFYEVLKEIEEIFNSLKGYEAKLINSRCKPVLNIYLTVKKENKKHE